VYRGIFCIGISFISAVLQAETDIEASVRQLWQVKDYVAAKALLQPMITKKTKDAQLLALLGKTEAELRNEEGAEHWLELALKYNSNNADYQHWYATVSCNLASSANMFSAMGYAKRCKKAYETALKLAPQNPRSYIALGGFYTQAPAIAGGDKAEALKLAARLKLLDPLEGALLQLRATEINSDAEFNAFLERETLLKSRPEPYLHRGVSHSRADEHAKAIAAFELALTMEAADEDASDARAQALYQIGRSAVKGKIAFGKGTSALHQFIEQRPTAENIDWAILRLGQLYLLQQQPEKAHAILKPLLAATRDGNLKDELEKLL
jgi:tetratricopeptide (TPR) repeat protein